MHERNDMQSKPVATDHHRAVLIIGISRGIGRGLAADGAGNHRHHRRAPSRRRPALPQPSE